VHFLGICEKKTAVQCQIPIVSSGETRFFSGSRHCAAVFFLQMHKKCTDLDLSLLYISSLGIYSKFARKRNFLALGVCFPQPCSSAGRRFAASRSRLQNYQRIVHDKHFDEMRCKLDSTENQRSFDSDK